MPWLLLCRTSGMPFLLLYWTFDKAVRRACRISGSVQKIPKLRFSHFFEKDLSRPVWLIPIRYHPGFCKVFSHCKTGCRNISSILETGQPSLAGVCRYPRRLHKAGCLSQKTFIGIPTPLWLLQGWYPPYRKKIVLLGDLVPASTSPATTTSSWPCL